MADPGKISVLITTRERPASLERTINSVLACGYAGGLEIIVVDDASGEASSARTKAYLEKVNAAGAVKAIYRLNSGLLGIFRNRNTLVSMMAADSSFALFLDDDIELEKGLLAMLESRLSGEPGAGLAGPRVVFMSDPGRTAHSANYVGRWTGFYTSLDSPRDIKCDWLISCCLLVKKEVLERTGGFYPGFYISHAEVDLCLAAKREGFSVLYCPGAAAAHDEQPGQFKRERLYYVYRNKLLMIRRNFGFPRNAAAFFISGLLAFPLHVAESVRFNGGLKFSELRLVLLALLHGLSGKEGPL